MPLRPRCGNWAHTMVADLYDVAACEAVIPAALRDFGPRSDLASRISGQNLTVDRSLSTKFAGGARKSRREMMETQQPR